MSQPEITLKKIHAQKSMMAAFGTAAHAVWQMIVRDYESKEKATVRAVAVSEKDDFEIIPWE